MGQDYLHVDDSVPLGSQVRKQGLDQKDRSPYVDMHDSSFVSNIRIPPKAEDIMTYFSNSSWSNDFSTLAGV